MFESSLVNDTARTARPYTVSLSVVLQVGLATFTATYPLWHIEALPFIRLRAPSPFRNAVELVDPKPAQPRSTPVAAFRKPVLTFPFDKLTPRRAANASQSSLQIDAPIIGDSFASNGLFDPGGPAGYDVRPGIAAAPPPLAVKPPERPAAPRGPVTVGGRVRPPQLLREVKPAYPPLARTARIQGSVKIEAILSREGAVRDARVVSGHPLLVAAALDAVRQWLYRPTILNEEPVEVKLAIDVNFTLSQ